MYCITLGYNSIGMPSIVVVVSKLNDIISFNLLNSKQIKD